MTLTDLVLLAALAAFVLAWLFRTMPKRAWVLSGSALLALGASVAAVLDHRWQANVGVIVAIVLLLVLGVNALRKRPTPAGVPFASGFVFALFATIAIAPLLLFPVPALPRPDGPHIVGVRSFELTDESRPGVLGAPADAPRRLLVRVWYPANETRGQPRPYFTDAEARTTATGLGSLFNFPQFFAYLKHVRTNSYEDATLLAGADDFPVVFYSHGYASFPGQNTVLMEHLASHGYVVFSVQHSYDASPTLFADGDVAPLAPEIAAEIGREPTDAARDALAGATLDVRLTGILNSIDTEIAESDRIFTQSAPHWVMDRLFVHDQLQAGAVPTEIAAIAAASNLQRVGEMGMSFGGSTTGAVCVIDPRCAAGVNLDGGDFHVLELDVHMPAPFLMFHSDPRFIYAAVGAAPGMQARAFNEFSYETIADAGSRADIYRFKLRDARHLGISDLSLFMSRPVRDVVLGPAPGAVTVGAQNAFVRGFFDRHVRGQANDFPEGAMAAYSDWVERVDVSDVAQWWAELPEAERAQYAQRLAGARGNAPSAAIPVRREAVD